MILEWDLALAALLVFGLGLKVFGAPRWAIQAYLVVANIALAAALFHFGFPVSANAFAVSSVIAAYYALKEYPR